MASFPESGVAKFEHRECHEVFNSRSYQITMTTGMRNPTFASSRTECFVQFDGEMQSPTKLGYSMEQRVWSMLLRHSTA